MERGGHVHLRWSFSESRTKGDAQMAPDRLSRALVNLLFAADQPKSAVELSILINQAHLNEEWGAETNAEAVTSVLRGLQDELSERIGLVLTEVAGGWRIRTGPEYRGLVRRLWPDKLLRLSKAALEVLAVVAYQQPCARSDIEGVRGVDCGGLIRNLLERGLLRISGRRNEAGRPLLYSTTPLFLETFSLSDIGALPTLRDLKALEGESKALELASKMAPVSAAEETKHSP